MVKTTLKAKDFAEEIYASMLNIDYKLSDGSIGITYEQAKYASLVCIEFLEEQEKRLIGLDWDFKCPWFSIVKQEIEKM